jgi:hypothetical protein
MMVLWNLLIGSVWARVIAACLAGLVALKAYGWTQQRVGAEKAVAKIEKATRHAVEKGSRAAERSGAPGVRGVVDPTTRYD